MCSSRSVTVVQALRIDRDAQQATCPCMFLVQMMKLSVKVGLNYPAKKTFLSQMWIVDSAKCPNTQDE